MVFSKTWCPFSDRAKRCFKTRGIENYKVVELDELPDEAEM